MSEPKGPRLPPRFRNPRACPICFGKWVLYTDDLGRVHHRHPPRKCVAPTYAPEDKGDPLAVADGRRNKRTRNPSPVRRCAMCRERLAPGSRTNVKFCSRKCAGLNRFLARYLRQKAA